MARLDAVALMGHFTIEKLDHRDDLVAREIHGVFQRSYRIEADLIGIEDFPPLRRTPRDLQKKNASFFGCRRGDDLAGVVELTQESGELDICSLVVDPGFFRQGVASRLLRSVLGSLAWEIAVVETAVANQPAIALYKKLGFIEVRRWVPSHGIPKVLLRAVPGTPR